jgi:hypothetical protein
MNKTTYFKIVLAGGVALFSISLAILIGNRLSTDAMGVLAGAACGVGAAIPTSLLIIAVTQRPRQHTETTQAPQPQYTPPIVMMTPPMQIQQPTPQPPPATWENAPIQRHFHVGGKIGEEE